jgi:hypothetical protein
MARIKAKGGAHQRHFSSQTPKELPQVTGRANRDHLPEDCLSGTGFVFSAKKVLFEEPS